LIVDDSSDDFLGFTRAFSRAGVVNPIVWLRSGREAISYLDSTDLCDEREQNPVPGVILLDLNIPDQDGFQILQWIRNKFPNGGMLIVVLTHVEEIRKINRAYSLGANTFLTKPGNLQELQELIHIFGGYWHLSHRLPSEEELLTKAS
jgi:DNA-binding response OmpR family regulator